MKGADSKVDAVVIGGGFYGAVIAIYLAKQRRLKRIFLVERESALLTRASSKNQSRVHNGYHYPRSFTTAYRSRVNFPRFISDWPDAVNLDFTNLYAIGRRNSKVTAKQFMRFCNEIEVKIELADRTMHQLFEPNLVEEVFLVKEGVFDYTELASWAEQELKKCGVEVLYEVSVTKIENTSESLKVSMLTRDASQVNIEARYVFNCAYSGLNQLSGDFPGTSISLKHEITEIALLDVPSLLKGLGITMMDGPFFSLMPFPARELHSLSHVRYTPHMHWFDKPGIDPYKHLADYECSSRVDRMVRDVSRYLPAVLDAKYVDSLFEIKTLLIKNEGDDGRPILFERHESLPGCYSILGGKIDNIYDILEKMDAEPIQ